MKRRNKTYRVSRIYKVTENHYVEATSMVKAIAQVEACTVGDPYETILGEPKYKAGRVYGIKKSEGGDTE